MKHVLAGLVAGALLTGVFLRLLPRERTGGSDVATEARTGSSSPDASADSAEEADAAALRDATARLERLRADVASLKAARPTGAAAAGKVSVAARSALVRLFLQNLDDYVNDRHLTVPANEEMSQQLQSLIRRLAEETGLSLDEVGASPEGFAALALEVLDGLEPKLDASARAAAEEVLATARREWEAFAKERGDMTRMERGGKAQEIQERLTSALEDRLQDRASDAIDALETLWDQSQPLWTGNRSIYLASSPEDAASKWTESWGSDLKLTPVQKNALRPIVDDYVRALSRLKEEGSGERGPAAFELMVRAQHRMLDTLGLSPEQVEELQAMSRVYDYQVHPGR